MMTTVISDMETAYTDAAGRAPSDSVELNAGLIGGETLPGGVYKWARLSFDADNNPDTVWIMQIA